MKSIRSFSDQYPELQDTFSALGFSLPFGDLKDEDITSLGKVFSIAGINRKKDELKKFVQNSESAAFPFDKNSFISLLCGGECAMQKLLKKNEEDDNDSSEALDGKISLAFDDEKFAEACAKLPSDIAEAVVACKKIYDWGILSRLLNGEDGGDSVSCISERKVKIYEQHQKDLKDLKSLIKKYLSKEECDKKEEERNKQKGEYYNFFKSCSEDDNYVGYSAHVSKKKDFLEKFDQENFDKNLNRILNEIEKKELSEDDREILKRLKDAKERNCLLPKQVTGDNRVIPYQIYFQELKDILENAKKHFEFLSKKDQDGLTPTDKICSIMKFRIPYYIGPLSGKSEEQRKKDGDNVWFIRKQQGRILPWNIKEMVDYEKSEQAFINRMIGQCTYLPGEPVLPKHSPIYEKYEVLNLLNNLAVNGVKISVEEKQLLFEEIRKSNKNKITKKFIEKIFHDNNRYRDFTADAITGVDDGFAAPLSSTRLFDGIRDENERPVLNEEQREEIVRYGACCEDKSRLREFVFKQDGSLSSDQCKKIANQNFTGFGKLSKKLLTEIKIFDPDLGVPCSILEKMWDTNESLMELLGDKYGYRRQVEQFCRNYYQEHPEKAGIQGLLDRMYLPKSVNRPILRTLRIAEEIQKAMQCPPKKIFVEMARELTDKPKSKQRTKSRHDQIEELYKKVKDIKSELLEEFRKHGDDVSLRKDNLFLYFMQLGKDMYTGKPIPIEDLIASQGDNSRFNKDHIYPKSLVKDDSVLNNLVLVDSIVNGVEKEDNYPLPPEIQERMRGFWEILKKNGLMTQEKFNRLTRTTPFSEKEEEGFINRQLVATRQATKAVGQLLNEIPGFEKTKVVYSKAPLVSDFRGKFKIAKSRILNDLHHTKDAYLNIVVGNVFDEIFSRNFWKLGVQRPSIKVESLFGKARFNDKNEIIWNTEDVLSSVKTILESNRMNVTSMTDFQRGQLFDLLPLKATKKTAKKNAKKAKTEDENDNGALFPRKRGLSPSQYGGYNKVANACFLLVSYEEVVQKKKGVEKTKEVSFLPVPIMFRKKILESREEAESYFLEELNHNAKKGVSYQDIQFPLGLRPIKPKTVIEVNGSYRFRINGKSNDTLVISLFTPLVLGEGKWGRQLSHLEKVQPCLPKDEKENFVCEDEYLTSEKNCEFYDSLIKLLSSEPYTLRPSPIHKLLKNGKEKEVFKTLSIQNQIKLLLGVISNYGRESRRGVNLKIIGGKEKSGVTTMSSKLSNWKKTYSDVRIVDYDISGLHERKSPNLLDFLKD